MAVDRRARAGVIGVVSAGTLALASLHLQQLPFVDADIAYRAEFADAGGLLAGDDVEVAGVNVGRVESIDLDRDRVRVVFSLPPRIRLGDASLARIQTTTLLGRRDLTVQPLGHGRLDPDATIPLERTTSPYSLNDALGDLSATVSQLDTAQLNKALDTLSQAMADTPAPLRSAMAGMSALSQSLNKRDDALRSLLTQAQSVTSVLGRRSGQIDSLLVDGNALLAELDARRTAIATLIVNIGAVSQQLTELVQQNRTQLKPTLDQLNSVLALLQRNKTKLDQSLDGLVGYATTLGEQVGSGPFFGAYVSNWGVDDYLQMLVDSMTMPQHLPQDLVHYLTDPPPSLLPPQGAPAPVEPPEGAPR
jgi:phospholipid/cholesterol/gamma-HCH transport system substrate-binding protein